MTNKKLIELTGGLSRPSKMPCYSFNLPASTCKRGAVLAKQQGSVCSKCYAMNGNYRFPNVQNALWRRYDLLMADMDNMLVSWTHHMTELIYRYEDSDYFRWHDSGDLQSVTHLSAINSIAIALPNIQFWLPTRELDIVESYLKEFKPQPNLTIRLSVDAIGNDKEPHPLFKSLPTSSVGSNNGWQCNARQHQNKCGACRACWQHKIKNVDYALH
tara:strand:- start:1270 stop:1914 length:645 start_codon:yes stop_codon:yes gene_type:complete